MKIEEAIQQRKFKNSFLKAHVNILYTASCLNLHITHTLKPFGITMQQFNILRILRGMKGKPATVKLLTERMIDKTSNASRLVDKLVSKGLTDRRECPHDRRQVEIYITDAGLEKIAQATEAIDQMLAAEFSHLTESDAEHLSDLLDQIRR